MELVVQVVNLEVMLEVDKTERHQVVVLVAMGLPFDEFRVML